jgi:hypothetical protein
MTVRYGGHCSKFYSVAEHSVLVAKLMDFYTGDGFEGLMHDASEAYLSDVPSPIKKILPDWGKIEDRVDKAMRYNYELPYKKTPVCDHCDKVALLIEAQDLIPSGGRGEGWDDYAGEYARQSADQLYGTFKVKCLTPKQAELDWLSTYHAYKLTR